jgi:hypothetical protein
MGSLDLELLQHRRQPGRLIVGVADRHSLLATAGLAEKVDRVNPVLFGERGNVRLPDDSRSTPGVQQDDRRAGSVSEAVRAHATEVGLDVVQARRRRQRLQPVVVSRLEPLTTCR